MLTWFVWWNSHSHLICCHLFSYYINSLDSTTLTVHSWANTLFWTSQERKVIDGAIWSGKTPENGGVQQTQKLFPPCKCPPFKYIFLFRKEKICWASLFFNGQKKTWMKTNVLHLLLLFIYIGISIPTFPRKTCCSRQFTSKTEHIIKPKKALPFTVAYLLQPWGPPKCPLWWS